MNFDTHANKISNFKLLRKPIKTLRKKKFNFRKFFSATNSVSDKSRYLWEILKTFVVLSKFSFQHIELRYYYLEQHFPASHIALKNDT